MRRQRREITRPARSNIYAHARTGFDILLLAGEWKRFTAGSAAAWRPIFPGRATIDPPSDVGVTELSNPERFLTDCDQSAFE